MSRLTALGFGKSGKDAGGKALPYQYYQFGTTQRSMGNPVHTFDTEELLMNTMGSDNRVTFCGVRGCFGNTTW